MLHELCRLLNASKIGLHCYLCRRHAGQAQAGR